MSFHLQIGQSVLLKAAVLDQNTNQIVNSPNQVGHMGGAASISWSSNHPNFATVTSGPGENRGYVTGIAAGTATLTATYTDTYGNTATQTIDVIVYKPAATSIQIIAPVQ